MSTPMHAYFQPRLVPDRAAAQADRLHSAARAYRGSLTGSLVREVAHPVELLWQLIEDTAARTGIDLPAQLHRAAKEREIDLAAVRAAPAPAAALLWLLAELSRRQSRYLLVPGPEHFEGFGVPGTVIEHLIATVAPDTTLVWSTPGARAGSGEAGLVAEIEVPAVASAVDAITQRLRRALALRGLSDLTAPLLRVLAVLMHDCVHAAHTELHAAATTAYIRICCPPGTDHLRADVRETPRHAGPLPDRLHQICTEIGARAQREHQPRSGTLTTVWLPLASAPLEDTAASSAARGVSS